VLCFALPSVYKRYSTLTTLLYSKTDGSPTVFLHSALDSCMPGQAQNNAEPTNRGSVWMKPQAQNNAEPNKRGSVWSAVRYEGQDTSENNKGAMEGSCCVCVLRRVRSQRSTTRSQISC
jgi:hypothetical protein